MLLSAVIISSLTIFVHCWQYTVHILPSALLTMSSSSLDKVSKYFSVLEFGNVYPRDFTSSLECTLHSSNWNNLIHCNEGLSDLSLCLVYSESPWYFIIRAPSDLSYLFFFKESDNLCKSKSSHQRLLALFILTGWSKGLEAKINILNKTSRAKGLIPSLNRMVVTLLPLCPMSTLEIYIKMCYIVSSPYHTSAGTKKFWTTKRSVCTVS